ncbi:hypothetical protein AB0M22_07130 [Nocardia sp. NPDC051756]|uniref:DUF7373 family lipoprotein n=1 Tax=Nocardia sp. NPDC051756 TaxID=3154751 RepID=UPI00341633FA
MHLLWRVAVVAAVLTLTACSSEDSQRQVEASAAATTTGNQPVDRQRIGALAEGARMAEAIALPAEVDPSLVYPGESGVLTRAMLLVSVGHNGAIRDAATKNGLLTGFVTSSSDASGSSFEKVVTQGIMRFPDRATATRAADDLADAALTSRGMLETDSRRAVTLPEASDTRFSLYDIHNASDRGDCVDSTAFTPHDRFVIFTRVSAKTEAQAAAATIRAAELQRPLLDSFAPTDDAKVADLSADPEGMYALSVGNDSGESGSYGPRGAALFAFDQLAALKLFQDAGMTAAGVRGTYAYRTRDPEAAQQLAQALADSAVRYRRIRDDRLLPAASPPEVAAARCWSIINAGSSNSWHCVVPQGRYVGEIWAGSAAEAHDLTTKQQRAFAAAR